MRYFYYLKTADKEMVYQDEEIVASKEQKEAILARIDSKEEVVATKAELEAEVETHKLEIYNPKTDTKTVVDAKDSTCLVRWDGSSPFYQVVKGISPEAIPFLGWPQVSEDNYVAPAEEQVKEIVEEVKEEKLVIETPEDKL